MVMVVQPAISYHDISISRILADDAKALPAGSLPAEPQAATLAEVRPAGQGLLFALQSIMMFQACPVLPALFLSFAKCQLIYTSGSTNGRHCWARSRMSGRSSRKSL